MAQNTPNSGFNLSVLSPIFTVWRRISPSLVPVFAVLTALIVTIPFMVVTEGQGSFRQGLTIAGKAYSALLEGSMGVAINPELTLNDVDLARTLADRQDLTQRELLLLSGRAEVLSTVGLENVRDYSEVLARYQGSELLPDAAAITALGERIPDIQRIGPDQLRNWQPLIEALAELPRRDVTLAAARFAVYDVLDDDLRAELVAFVPAAEAYDDDVLLDLMRLLTVQNIVSLTRILEQLAVLDALELDAYEADADDIAGVVGLGTPNTSGVDRINQLNEVLVRFEAAGIREHTRLAGQLRLVLRLYEAGIIRNPDVYVALTEELPVSMEGSLIVRRPNNRVLVHAGVDQTAAVIHDTNRDRPQVAYLRLGSSVLMFFPANLETTLTRAIPFVIAGLAVALGFKTGLFNIGAEGQLYIGATLAAWVGFSTIFTSLPALIHLPLVLMAGFLGGMIWGFIPGALKAFTGAHEVISTIMLNFIAIRFVDWLIKSPNPVVLRDMSASAPRTPYLAPSATLPDFSTIAALWFVASALLMVAVGLWLRRDQLARNPRVAMRPLVYGALVLVGGFFLQWITIRDNLHLGLVLMILIVWVVDWFLERTTIGFELRTVGANPDAARYAGMSVRGSTILALTLSGALVGLAGTIQVSGVQNYMEPDFFSGLGFDSIAVALLARNNPRNMIAAGILWGALLTGAGLMQERASISNDLVKIIQALIIMFIAADAIIRYLWRVPQVGDEEKVTTFAKGWGG